MKKKGVSKTILTMLLIAGMCIPVPAAYAAEVPSETGVVIETEMESEQEELTDEDQAADIETQAETETEAVTETETEAVTETESEAVTETETEAAAETETEAAAEAESETATENDTEVPAETDTSAETEVETETEEVLLDASAIKPEAVKKITAKADCCSIELQWEAAQNATGYKIFSYDKETKKLTAVVSTRALKYTITGLQDGTEYSYRVRSYNSDNDEKKAIFGDYSAIVSAIPGTPEQVKKIDVKSGPQSLTLSWNAVKNATGYVIYYIDSGMPGEVARTKALSHKFEYLQNGTSYWYQVRPYHTHGSKTVYGPYSEIIKGIAGQLDAIQNLSIKSGNGTVTLSWDAVENASAYRIVSYDPKTHKIASVANTNKLTYTIKDLTNGTSYSYKVRAYNSNWTVPMYGPYSNAVTAVPGTPGQIKSLKAKAGNGSVTLSWSAADLATGYRVFAYDPATGKLTGIKSVTARTYTVTGLKNGESCSFKVRPYNNSSGKIVCGAYSKAVEAIPGRPGPITDLKAQSAGTEVFLSWTAEETASYYQVFQFDFSTKKWKNIKRVTDSNAMITGLPTKTACRFRVLAYNRVNDKLLYTGSNIVNVTTGGTLTGWVTIGSDKYYYKNGARLKKYQQINGKYYYFDDTTGKMLTGWKYVYGFKLYFDPKTGARWNDVDSLIGKRSSYVIKVNCQANVVNIYAKDGDNGYVIPVKAFVCTTGASSTPTVKGTFYTPDKWRWQVLMGPSYGQWVTQIYRGYYFHSVFYNNYNDNNSLAVGAYNNLGKSGSHGCVRLTAGDAKWIYDNCSLGTKVITYSDSTPGPLGKPSSYKLPSWHTWDPTDPNMKNKCKQRGCH